MIQLAAACTLALSLLVPASPAMAKDGGAEQRVAGTCGRGASSELRLRARDGSIRVDFAVRSRTRGSWRAVVVHERRVEWRGSMGRSESSYKVRRFVSDIGGPDEIRVRASGPGGTTCSATATLRA